MEEIFQNTNIWVTEASELLQKYSTATVTLVIETLGVTTELTNAIKPSDDFLGDVSIFFKQFAGVDYFQWQLLKIFVSVLVTLVMMIFCAWYVYGAKITERFMTSGAKIDDRNNFKYYSPHF